MSGVDACFFAMGLLGVYLLLEILCTLNTISKQIRRYFHASRGSY
jgi:hypothetical protein